MRVELQDCSASTYPTPIPILLSLTGTKERGCRRSTRRASPELDRIRSLLTAGEPDLLTLPPIQSNTKLTTVVVDSGRRNRR
jgi:hypothetical protein